MFVLIFVEEVVGVAANREKATLMHASETKRRGAMCIGTIKYCRELVKDFFRKKKCSIKPNTFCNCRQKMLVFHKI